MPAKRTPLKRPQRTRITSEAVEAFIRAREIQDSEDADCWEDEGGRHREMLDAISALHRALGLRPWEYSPADVGDNPRPTWANDSWEQAQELRRLLEDAPRLPPHRRSQSTRSR